jgi:predicted metallopeptidase
LEKLRMSDGSRIVGRPFTMPPLELHWHGHSPLPLREVTGLRRRRAARAEAPPWIETGSPDEPFHFSENLRLLCTDIAARYAPLAHIDVARMIFGFTQARHGRGHGLQARVTPLRFHGGERCRTFRGIAYQVQQFFHNRKEILYVVTFCLPRFLNRTFDDKFVTIFHELFHISPAFDGDLRRHGGRYSVHSASRKRYDVEMMAMAREYLQGGADPKLHAFLRLSFAQLCHRHGRVVGHVVPRPKLVPLRSLGFAS